MQGPRRVWLGKAREQAHRQHGTNVPGHNLFRRLGDELAVPRHCLSGQYSVFAVPTPARHVDVVAQLWATNTIPPIPVSLVAPYSASPRPFFLFHRQRGGSCAHRDGGPVAFL